jgi:hypothetical protein
MRTLMVVIVTLSAACGSGAVSRDDYPAALRDARCHYLVSCGAVDNLDTCRKANIGGLGGLDPDLVVQRLSASVQAAIGKGKIAYDGGSAQACLDALAGRSCDVTSQDNRVVPDACQDILTGTQHDGAACADNLECISRQCNVPLCNMACCTGTCAGDVAPARAKLGESCEHARCEDTLFCDQAVVMCVALKPVDAFCASASECAFGLDCLPTAACGALPGPGDACTGACRDEGTTCGAASRTCVKAALGGAACAATADCAPIYLCDATKHCSAGPALGAACTLNQPCGGDGAFCDIPDGQAMGTCVLPKADGSPCQLDSNCQSQRCDPMALMCVPEPVCI